MVFDFSAGEWGAVEWVFFVELWYVVIVSHFVLY